MDQRSEQVERRLEVPIMVASLLVIPLLVIEEGHYGEAWDSIGIALNWGTWLMFVAEAIVMLSVVPDRWRWIRDHPIDVAVVVLTPPFLAALAPVRLLRLLRLLRLVRLARVARFLFTADGLRYAAVLAALTAVAGGAAFAEVEEGQSAVNGIYWALTTMTTVGYGDPSPQTTGGKVLAIGVMLVGIGFVAILTGAVAERFLARDVEEIVDAEEELSATDDVILRELRELRSRLVNLETAVQRRPRS